MAAFMDEVFPSRKRNNHFSVREKKNDSRVVCLGDESSHLKSPTRTDPLIFLPGCLLLDELSSKCRWRSSKIYFQRSVSLWQLWLISSKSHSLFFCRVFFPSQAASHSVAGGCRLMDHLLVSGRLWSWCFLQQPNTCDAAARRWFSWSAVSDMGCINYPGSSRKLSSPSGTQSGCSRDGADYLLKVGLELWTEKLKGGQKGRKEKAMEWLRVVMRGSEVLFFWGGFFALMPAGKLKPCFHSEWERDGF